jgi:hypothetical protein
MQDHGRSAAELLALVMGPVAALWDDRVPDAALLIDATVREDRTNEALTVTPWLLRQLVYPDPDSPDEDAHQLASEFVNAAWDLASPSAVTVGAVALAVAAQRPMVVGWSESWQDLADDPYTPLWGAVTSTWFALGRSARRKGVQPYDAARRLCLTFARLA